MRSMPISIKPSEEKQRHENLSTLAAADNVKQHIGDAVGALPPFRSVVIQEKFA